MIPLQRFALLLLPALLAAGCGQKGPLYLEGREPPSQRVSAPKKRPPAQPESAPAEKEPTQEEQP
jgi:predicted small lipoprotein YifL